MEISDDLLCLFSAQVERREGSYVIEVPEQELRLGEIADGETYQVAMIGEVSDPEPTTEEIERNRERGAQTPPIERGDTRDVEIEDIGEQGDGITRVERGFVVIVPDTEKGERVSIEITDVRETVAFADVVERLSYYE